MEIQLHYIACAFYSYVETEEQSNRFDEGTMPVGLTIPSIYLCEDDVKVLVKIAKEIGWLKEETKKRQIDTMTEEALTKVITDWRNGVYCQGERCDCSCSEALAHYLLSPTKESK